jgi:hypothetical protein
MHAAPAPRSGLPAVQAGNIGDIPAADIASIDVALDAGTVVSGPVACGTAST